MARHTPSTAHVPTNPNFPGMEGVMQNPLRPLAEPASSTAGRSALHGEQVGAGQVGACIGYVTAQGHTARDNHQRTRSGLRGRLDGRVDASATVHKYLKFRVQNARKKASATTIAIGGLIATQAWRYGEVIY